jgi:hypothetical protein
MIGPRTRRAALALGIVGGLGGLGATEAAAQFVWPWQQQPQPQPSSPRVAPPAAAAPRQLAPQRPAGQRAAPRREEASDGQQRARREGPEGRRRGATGPLTATSATAAAVGAVGATGAAEAAGPSNFPRRLDQRAIRARFFDGEPINARALGGELFTVRFHPDGRLVRISRSGEERAGRWRFQGDAYCSRWEGNRAESCHTIVEEGQVVRVVRNTRAVATWARGSTPPAP